jgi:glutathione S-transferase
MTNSARFDSADAQPVRVLGRSSSHHTRCVRLLAHELGVAHELAPIADLSSESSDDFGGNPALRLPILITEQGAWYGTLNSCRALARRVQRSAEIVWPEDLSERIAANAQELVLQGMSSEVTWIMSRLGDPAHTSAYAAKNLLSVQNSLAWLEKNLGQVLRQLREDRRLSFFELTLFCFITHLSFRQVIDTRPLRELRTFERQFAARASARQTEYRFDVT